MTEQKMHEFSTKKHKTAVETLFTQQHKNHETFHHCQHCLLKCVYHQNSG